MLVELQERFQGDVTRRPAAHPQKLQEKICIFSAHTDAIYMKHVETATLPNTKYPTLGT